MRHLLMAYRYLSLKWDIADTVIACDTVNKRDSDVYGKYKCANQGTMPLHKTKHGFIIANFKSIKQRWQASAKMFPLVIRNCNKLM